MILQARLIKYKSMTKNKVHPQHIVPLYSVDAERWIKIHSLPKGLLHAQFIRLGVYEGERVRCIERLPGGTVVIQKNRQQIAIGHLLAKQIFVIVLHMGE